MFVSFCDDCILKYESESGEEFAPVSFVCDHSLSFDVNCIDCLCRPTQVSCDCAVFGTGRGRVYCVNVFSGALSFCGTYHDERVVCLCSNSCCCTSSDDDCSLFMSGGADGRVCVYKDIHHHCDSDDSDDQHNNMMMGSFFVEKNKKEDCVCCMEVLRGTSLFCCGCSSGDVHLFDMEKMTEERKVEGSKSIRDVSFCHNGHVLFCAHSSGNVHFYSLKQNKVVDSFLPFPKEDPQHSSINNLNVLPQKHLLAVTNQNTLKVFDLRNKKKTIWKKKFQQKDNIQYITTATKKEQNIFIQTQENIQILDIKTGQKKWTKQNKTNSFFTKIV